ncbi:MAG: hypothetical protein Q7K13_05895 [Polynucleobacter sp.]|uniref:hypothetical protein n=1 Tax=Polynucleobacter sp. TaxID=2029855 RepID=UPI002719070A|nr:hypothetical protein [Polynucleobacter sp.]MDO8713994.1 hypothetical protein [Polynucleobacter sp.]
MSNGAGKYDHLCTEVRTKAESKGAIIIVLGGNLGSGFSVQADIDTLSQLPDMLETIAKQIRQSAH